MNRHPLTLHMTPHGALVLDEAEDAAPVGTDLAERLERTFKLGAGHGLLHLGAGEVTTALPPVFAYWRDFSSRYVTTLCSLPEVAEETSDEFTVPLLSKSSLQSLAESAPLMVGAEYVTPESLTALWQSVDTALRTELKKSGLPLQRYLASLHSAWHLVGRVHFNLAENRKDEHFPFAFMATYTTRLSANAKAQHVPLGQALRNYSKEEDKDRLMALLQPVQIAADRCRWLANMVSSGELFHPMRWGVKEVVRFLQDVPLLESAGVVVRMPAGWRMNKPSRPQVRATVGGKEPSQVGLEGLLDFRMEITLDGETLTKEEIKKILEGADGLAMLRGKWVEIDHERLNQTLEQFKTIEQTAAKDGLSFGEAMRMLSGAELGDTEEALQGNAADWGKIVAGPWLANTLKQMRDPKELELIEPGKNLHATLRPYQTSGMQWLYLLTKLGLGACLADDMGLGKTIQILALLLVWKNQNKGKKNKPSLLVAPASLLANWAAELANFTPTLNFMIAHPSSMPAHEFKSLTAKKLVDVDLVMTSYGSLERLPWLMTTEWRLLVLDEAQAIKNAQTKQTKASKRLKADARIALTGTPIENRLGDLWSIFDFINPGLLGTSKQFSNFVKQLAEKPHNPYAPLRDLVRPYILRRLKTDKKIIDDLPDKTEIRTFCGLSRTQAALYQQTLDEVAAKLVMADGIQRKGLVLSLLMRLKQICNHPSQWLGDEKWEEEESGKLARLRELGEIIAAKQEKVLIFTQFKEMTEPLSAFLTDVFGKPGLVLHGETEVKKRAELVRRFQEDEDVPFFVLSLKAGGTGLNLTAAAHVIHFDRWWNPAVENQATDRAFRIGQKKNVLVHKFVCRGTVEERIDKMIESKQQLAGDFLDTGAEIRLTEMKDDELLHLVSLDLNAALKEI